MFKFVNKRLRNRKGFTLIELVVVIAILGILVAIAVPRLTGVRSGAELSADEASARVVASAYSIYEADNGAPPADIDALIPDYLDAVPISETNGEAIDNFGTATDGGLTIGDDTTTFYPPSN